MTLPVIGWAMENPAVMDALDAVAHRHGADFSVAFCGDSLIASEFPEIDPLTVVAVRHDGKPLAYITPDGTSHDLAEG